MEQKHKIFIGVTLLNIVGVFFQIFYEYEIFQYVLNFIVDIQKSMDNDFFKVLFNIFSSLVNPNLVVVILIVYFSFVQDKRKTLNFLLYFIVISYICTYFKTIIGQPRPYWVQFNIQDFEWVCYAEYGNPSGHALLGSLLIEFFMMEILDCFENSNKKKVVYWVTLISGFLVYFLILFSRMYLGMHAANQIMLGSTLGFYFIVCYRFYFQDMIQKGCEFLTEKAHDISKQKMQIILFIVLLQIVLTLIPFIMYLIIKKERQNDQVEEFWYINIVEKCKIKDTNFDKLKNKLFFYKCFVDASLIEAGFGLLYGFLLNKHDYFIKGEFVLKQDNIKYKLINFGIIIGVSVLCLLLLVIPQGHYVIIMYFQQGIALGLASFSILFVVPKILSKYGFISKVGGDLLQQQMLNQSQHKSNSQDSLKKSQSNPSCIDLTDQKQNSNENQF